MSAAYLLNASGKLQSGLLTTYNQPSLGVPILQTAGAVNANLTGTFNCPADGVYIMQLYIRITGTSASVGTGSCGLTYTSQDGWGTTVIPVNSLIANPATGNVAFTQVLIGFIDAGTQTFTFSPSTGLNLGTTGEVSVRVLKALV
jgi:hypothetical protein